MLIETLMKKFKLRDLENVEFEDPHRNISNGTLKNISLF